MSRKRVHTPHPEWLSKKADKARTKNNDALLNDSTDQISTDNHIGHELLASDSVENEHEEDDQCSSNGQHQETFMCKSMEDSLSLSNRIGDLLYRYEEISNLSSSVVRSKLQLNAEAQRVDWTETPPNVERVESSAQTFVCPYCSRSSSDKEFFASYSKKVPRGETHANYYQSKSQSSKEGDDAAGQPAEIENCWSDCNNNLKSFQENSKRRIQTKLAVTVLKNPVSLRSYCSLAQLFRARLENVTKPQPLDESFIKSDVLKNESYSSSPLSSVERLVCYPRSLICTRCQEEFAALMHSLSSNQSNRFFLVDVFKFAVNSILDNVPHISVFSQIVGSTSEFHLTVLLSVCQLGAQCVNASVTVMVHSASRIFYFLRHVNPNLAVDAAVRTTEVLASSMQSVAEGTIAASAALQHYFPSGGGGGTYHHAGVVGTSPTRSFLGKIPGVVNMARGRGDDATNKVLSDRLYRKLSKIDSTSKVISYLERHDEVLSSRQKQRVQRMMHYEISLRPFVATVIAPKAQIIEENVTSTGNELKLSRHGSSATKFNSQLPQALQEKFNKESTLQQRQNSFSNFDWQESAEIGVPANDLRIATPSPQLSSYESSPNSESTDGSSPFLCTPKSFPPTPGSRSMVLARGSRLAEDVVFFAREHLRVEDALTSSNEKTRSVAMSLREGKRLAVFNADHANSGIELSSGQHCATKVGNELYCTTRCMVPILKNCFVYFEMSVWNPLDHASMPPLLSIGLSTLEMPNNHLVGSWKSSVALLSTGQIMAAGQWYSPMDPSSASYGNNRTVGCLVYLDDKSPFETWDGLMITAKLTFNVNGHLPSHLSPPFGNTGGFGHSIDTGASDSSATPIYLHVPMDEDLYPSLTLHSPATRVWCRFCAEDILSNSRESIGAPEGVAVYAVDGSVLFESNAL